MKIEKSKTDSELGAKIVERFKQLGIETPWKENGLSSEKKVDAITALLQDALTILGYDLDDDSMQDTPRRIAKLWTNDFCSDPGLKDFPKCTTVDNKMAVEDEFVCVKNIRINSTCEHHFLPWFGDQAGHVGATVAYIPNKKVLGISKIPRTVQAIASSTVSVQERTCHQIMEALKVILDTDDVAVYISAVHTCMTTRGVADPNASTVTVAMDGKFKEDHTVRKEFLDICKQ